VYVPRACVHVQTLEALKNHPGFVKRLAVHTAGSSPRLAEVMWLFMEDESVDPLGVVEVSVRALTCNLPVVFANCVFSSLSLSRNTHART
jgi:hypothetical protein